MKKLFIKLLSSDMKNPVYNFAILLFRIGIAAQLIVVHGLKKIGIGVTSVEVIPNPFGFPDTMNNFIAIMANVYLPFFIIIGLFTRAAALPAMMVTATGYFIVHANDVNTIKDIPYMYTISLLTIIFLGSGKYSLDYYISKSLNV
ncbi:DoxX family protein [Flavobacterium suzhouense]|uniref:DoxX family protein n=1 Tax=Flavobacterium suzhouense TaxID=1529638 RepID=A0ABW5NWF9_9FLAO